MSNIFCPAAWVQVIEFLKKGEGWKYIVFSLVTMNYVLLSLD